ncbi:MAG: hypothetical protein AAF467_15960 [Actinomycetota bacterium]
MSEHPRPATNALVTERARMEARLIAGDPPGPGDLKTLWEAYQAAVVTGNAWGERRLPDDLVAEMKADHDALVRELRARRAS